MKTYSSNRVVAHSPQDMFDLVADIERYPEFVPLCTGLRVKSRDTDGALETIVALMQVSYKMFREAYTSRVVLDRDAMTIDVTQTSGPFKTLENHWHFEAIGEGKTQVNFELRYEFKSRLLQATAGAFVDQAFSRFAEAFEKRADALYA